MGQTLAIVTFCDAILYVIDRKLGNHTITSVFGYDWAPLTSDLVLRLNYAYSVTVLVKDQIFGKFCVG